MLLRLQPRVLETVFKWAAGLKGWRAMVFDSKSLNVFGKEIAAVRSLFRRHNDMMYIRPECEACIRVMCCILAVEDIFFIYLSWFHLPHSREAPGGYRYKARWF